MQKILFTIAFALGVSLFQGQTGYACTCAGPATVLDGYNGAEVVLIARVASVETFREEDRLVPRTGPYTSRLVVEKIYKGEGSVRSDEMLVFEQGVGTNCVSSFSNREIGEKYLLYLRVPRAESLWRVSTCGRSDNVKRAVEDLLYLDKLEKVQGKTRVSGRYRGGFSRVELNVAGRKIRIVGASGTYETKTDENGIFEIYDLPPGKYRLEPEIPAGLIIDASWMWHSEAVLRLETTETSVSFQLPPQKHVTLSLGFTTKETKPVRRK